MPLVSVIIPVRDDDAALDALLSCLPATPDVEHAVSHAGVPSERQRALRRARPDVRWVDGPPGRGRQLNAGAAVASGRWLWFLHADCMPPVGWVELFTAMDHDAGIGGGSFAFRLDAAAWQARLLEHAVALRVRLFGLPYGDQGIFVRRAVFDQIGGFADWPLMEDVHFVRRLARATTVRHLTVPLVTSARRWERDGWMRRSTRNVLTLAAYAAGMSPQRLARRYDR